jgi:hypothetical protein
MRACTASTAHGAAGSQIRALPWLEIPSACIEPNRLRPFAAELARLLSARDVEAVCGPLVFLAQWSPRNFARNSI